MQGYTKILEVTHENLLPAMDRCCVVLTTLRGLAKYHDESSTFNVPPEDFTRILEILRYFRLLAHDILIYAGEERQQFIVFSKWLRHQIDIQATDPSSSSAEETAEKDSGLDYVKLLAYIQGPLTASRLSAFLSATGSQVKSPESILLYEDLVKEVERHQKGLSPKPESLSIRRICSIFTQQCTKLFQKITSRRAGSSSMDFGILLDEEQHFSCYDMRMMQGVSYNLFDDKTSHILICRYLNIQTFSLRGSPSYHMVPKTKV
jgi:anaphase-promoting complex subunit 4